jgi:phosphoglycerate dehydrogenase-like enzyme
MELKNKTLGIIGTGNIARQLILKAKVFGMKIILLGRQRSADDVASELEVEKANSLTELLKDSDYVSLHIPLTKDTRNLICERELKLMKKGSFLINTSRGGIIDEYALANELKSRERNIAGAAIDTFENEKSDYTSPLIGLSNVLLTPHIAGLTPQSLENSAIMAANNAAAIVNGLFNVPIVNRDVLKKRTK